MKNIFKGLLLSMLCGLTIVFVSCTQDQLKDIDKNNLGLDAEEQLDNEKEEKNLPSVEDDFSPNVVFITIKQKYSNHLYTIDDFSDLGLEKIECTTEYAFDQYSDGKYPENFYHIYKLTLKEKTKENVIKVIKELVELDFIDSASPNYTMSLPETYPSE